MRRARNSASACERRSAAPCRSGCRARRRDRRSRKPLPVEADLTAARSTDCCPAGGRRPASPRVRPSRRRQAAADPLRRHRDRGPGGGVKGMIELDRTATLRSRISRPSHSPTATRRRCGRSRAGRHAEGDHARRSVRRARLHQVGDQQPVRSEGQQASARLRSRRQARRGHRLQRRGAARPRIELSRRDGPDAHLRHDRQARARCRADRRSARLSGRAPGHLSRIERRRRAVALHRHLFARGRRADVDRDGSADRRASRRRKACSTFATSRSAAKRSWSARCQRRPPDAASNGVEFARMRVEFTRVPASSRCATAWCGARSIGATIEGQIDYARDDVRLRGTFVPLYALNNLLGACRSSGCSSAARRKACSA